MKFAMMIIGDDTEWADLPADEEQRLMKEIYGWYERWEPTGKIADGGAELQPQTTARTVRSGADGGPVVTDGPYMELKEVVGGIVIIEADTMEEAVEIASTWPRGAGMTAVEVRPVMARE
jgi:hypothetical protein